MIILASYWGFVFKDLFHFRTETENVKGGNFQKSPPIIFSSNKEDKKKANKNDGWWWWGSQKTCTFSLFFLETTNFDFILIFFLSSELFEAQNFTFFSIHFLAILNVSIRCVVIRFVGLQNSDEVWTRIFFKTTKLTFRSLSMIDLILLFFRSFLYCFDWERLSVKSVFSTF